jgi:acyl-CoA dehydrogenase
MMADCATMAVRTGQAGQKGISLLVVPLKDYPGVSRRPLKVSGQATAGTTFIELDDVKVPREYLIGQEGEGMKYIMNNFNWERFWIAVGTTRQARVALSTTFEYCTMREAFGKVVYPWFPKLVCQIYHGEVNHFLIASHGPSRRSPSNC